MRWNSHIFEYVTFRPRMARDLANASLTTNITLTNGAGVSTTFHASSPIFFAPSGSHGKVNPQVAEKWVSILPLSLNIIVFRRGN